MIKPAIARARMHSRNDRMLGAGLPLAMPAASVATIVRARRVEHRDGAGHLDPAHETALRVRVIDRARHADERAFVSGPSSADSGAEEYGEDFVMTVTTGEDGGEAALDEETEEERGGPFVETSAGSEFAYGVDESNPAGATREPFPKT